MIWRRRRRRAGRSTLAEFRRRRRRALRTEWRGWAVLVGLLVVAVVATWRFDGAWELVFAGFVGAMVMFLVFAWMTGLDLHSMSWLWGYWGEQWTEEEVDRLGDGWLIEHDVARARGNWDHVVVGPPGVFLLDSKHFHEPVRVDGDVLVTGRSRYEGRVFRGPAVGLSEVLKRRVGARPWVQAVAVIWGEFPQRVYESERVVYVHGLELVQWLESQPQRLSEERRRVIFESIRDVAADAAGGGTGL
jgi:hypothetical protein